MKRCYYKSKEGNSFLNLKSPISQAELEKYEEITEEEFAELTKPKVYVPSEVEFAKQAKMKFIAEKKAILVKYREEVEQVSLVGMEREDFEEKKEACKALVEKLRVLEKEVK